MDQVFTIKIPQAATARQGNMEKRHCNISLEI